MKTLIVCMSVSHGNTRKVADAIAGELGATVVAPDEIEPSALAAYDVVGFGSGIFNMRFHPRLRRFVADLPVFEGKEAFVFSTRGGFELPFWRYTPGMVQALEAKGFDVVGTFSCRAWDTWWPLRLVGVINKGRPDVTDLDAARRFAVRVKGARPIHHAAEEHTHG
jgi:flavodoxin